MSANGNGRRRPRLGAGAFTLAEVARYTKLHRSRVDSWFRGRSDGRGAGPLLAGDYVSKHGRFLASFLDMIDVLVAGQFRDFGVSMQAVRQAYSALQRQLETVHPFCRRGLYTDGQKVIIEVVDALGNPKLREAVSGQRLFAQIKSHLAGVTYDESTELAKAWSIARGVVIDPRLSMGRPVVRSAGITTYVLANAYFANERNSELVANLFEVPKTQVQDAVRFERAYGNKRAA